jgi:hypothetical protein
VKQSYDVVLKMSIRGSDPNSNYEHYSIGTNPSDLSGKYSTRVGYISLNTPTTLGYVYHDFDDARGVNQLRSIEEDFSKQLRDKISDLIDTTFWELEKQIQDLEKEYHRKANEYLVENFRPKKFPNFKKLEAA